MLKLENLTRVYRGKIALSNVSFELAAGKTCLLLGPNGSGKTTMMKMIAGLVSPTSGSIQFDALPICPASKREIAYMPTENYFYNYMSVRDAGRYYADFFSDFDFHNFENMIERARIAMDARIRTLSSGMSAKLRLALTLSRDAKLMMFDEPINGVDMITRDWVIDEIAARRNGERIQLISTHLVEQAEHIADSVICLKEGEMVLAGDLKTVCAEKSLETLYREIYGENREEGGSEKC